MQLRGYQAKGKHDIYDAWYAKYTNVGYSLGCGGGKTPVVSCIFKEHSAPSCAIAHRQELVGQISQAMARDDIRHNVIGPKKVIQFIVKNHMDEFGRSYFDANSPCAVAGVDTLIRRDKELERWRKSVSLWAIDEGHHVLRKNKWGKAVRMFPNSKGLIVSATFGRADGAGLGSHADGVVDKLIYGPGPRQLINSGFLTDYKIYAPESEGFNRDSITTGINGDFTQKGASKAVKDSCIVGDIVKHYLEIAPGKIGITFVPNIEIAEATAKKYNDVGVPAEVISAETPAAQRELAKKKLENRELLQLVNVDLFGEGFDLPSIEVVSMARPTKSLALFIQQFMRCLRLMISPVLMAAWDTYTDAQRKQFIAESAKPYGIVIDHVYNVDTTNGGHGLPDARRVWTLNRRDKRSKAKINDVIPTRSCAGCTMPYERIYKACPECGCIPIVLDRSSPAAVDGDLTEIHPDVLAAMRGEVAHMDMSVDDYKLEQAEKFAPAIGIHVNGIRHAKNQEMQAALRESIAWWAGYHRDLGRSDDEIYRRFYFAFGIDVLSAKALKKSDALELANAINEQIGDMTNDRLLLC